MLSGRSAIVTGAGQGIGRALARGLAAEGMTVCVVDRNAEAAQAVAAEIGGVSCACDLRDPAGIETMVARAKQALGRIDMLVSNAGFAVGAMAGPCSAPDRVWQDSWDLHVMAHLRAARLVLPEMRARGEGWLVTVASAAGLLSQIGDAPYSASKHAAVSLAQSLAIEYGNDGIRVSVVCPLYVATPLLGYPSDGSVDRANDRVLTAGEVAETTLAGIKAGRFLILPHEEAGLFFRRRAEDTDRWIDGMRRLRRKVFEAGVPGSLKDLHRRL